MASRFCLGIPEAAFYPGAIYLLSRWYTRKVTYDQKIPEQVLTCWPQELAFRSAILYGGLLISNAFGSVSLYAAFCDRTALNTLAVDGSRHPCKHGRKIGH